MAQDLDYDSEEAAPIEQIKRQDSGDAKSAVKLADQIQALIRTAELIRL